MKREKTSKKEGVKVEKDPVTGLPTVYPDPPKYTLADLPPQIVNEEKQVQLIIDFIEEFKNYMSVGHITDLIKFILLPIFQDPDKRSRLIEAIEKAKTEEQKEIEAKFAEDPEALLSDIPHNGLTLIKDTLADIEGMTPQEIENALQQFYRKPPFLSMPNTKLSNYLFDNAHDLTEPTALVVSGSKKKEIAVNTQVFISLLDEDGAQIPQNITAYDRAVHDGVCSILAHNKDMTATNRQIYEAMTGKATTSPQALGHVTRSLNKLRNTTLYLDYSKQAQAKGLAFDRMVFDGNLLNFVGLEITSSGQTVHGYKFLSVPILYEYAVNMGQIVTVDKGLLDIPNVSNTEDSVVLRHYMIRRIEAMKNPHNGIRNNNILFSSMFEYCGITGTKTELSRKRKIVYDTLQAWVDIGYIKEYAEYKQGRKIAGVEITLR